MKFFSFVAFLFINVPFAFCQDTTLEKKDTDTFFLSKQKGLLGELGKRVEGEDKLSRPEQANPFLKYTGKTIRYVAVEVLGFEKDISDTSKYKRSLGVGVANALHKNTTIKTAQNHLFFKEGEKLNPFLLADNERYLRDQVFIQDAIIHVKDIKGMTDSVDLVVLVKDVFSLGGSIGISNATKYRVEAKEENFGGTGTKIGVNTLWDNQRDPKYGLGAEVIRRNIRGTFINGSIGFRNYKSSFNGGGDAENTYYLHFEKPLVSQYLSWMGALDLSYNKTSNYYLPDTVYRSAYKYGYYNADGWIAYNFGSYRRLYKNLKTKTREFIALRAFDRHFIKKPDKYMDNFKAAYSDFSGVLGSVSMFKQNFYRANYVYGFGRNEDIPQGFSASFVGGYTGRQDTILNNIKSRPYFGFDGQLSQYSRNGFYSAYTFRFGGYKYKGSWEDVSLLFNVEHFTRLRHIRERWFRRFFLTGGIARQFSPQLEEPLKLRSAFGLPYFKYTYDSTDLGLPVKTYDSSDFRLSLKTEMVFYHTRKFWGFRFAPFAFGDIALLKPVHESFSRSDLFGAIGAGVRTRNENLIFGTIEMRCFYFPRILPGMNHFWIKFNTNLRFRYNSTFIRQPDFVTPN